MLARHHRAAEIYRHDAIERLGRYLCHRSIATGDADAHVVVQHVEPLPSAHTLADGGFHTGLVGDIRLECYRLTALVVDQLRSLFGRRGIFVDGQHPGALTSEQQCARAPVSHGRPRCLPCSHDDDNFSFESQDAPPGPKTLHKNGDALILCQTSFERPLSGKIFVQAEIDVALGFEHVPNPLSKRDGARASRALLGIEQIVSALGR